MVDSSAEQALHSSGTFVQGLDALMQALTAWNGGVILISHDERFITTVAKEVSVHMFNADKDTSTWMSFSCGCAPTAPSRSSRATYRRTR